MAHITLSHKAYKHNFNLISSYIGSNVEIAAVLKDNAYGHGLEQISAFARECGIQSVFVKNYSEALRVSEDFAHITALYGMPEGKFSPHIAFVVNQKEHIYALKKGTKVELKVNAGMNRNGVESKELEDFILAILKQGLELVGVFCHNGYGDEKDRAFYETQNTFASIKTHIKALSLKYGFKLPRFHSLSSSGAIALAGEGGISDDLVRIGIALYGYLDVAFANPISAQLQKVAALYADRVSTRYLKKGARIGYSGCTTLQDSSQISTYDIGYGDGFFRVSEDHKVYTAKGYQILPRSSMDCFSCLCSEPQICVFDDANVIARAFHTISYEVLTHLSPNLKRIIIK